MRGAPILGFLRSSMVALQLCDDSLLGECPVKLSSLAIYVFCDSRKERRLAGHFLLEMGLR